MHGTGQAEEAEVSGVAVDGGGTRGLEGEEKWPGYPPAIQTNNKSAF
jgi:hypothetical protein